MDNYTLKQEADILKIKVSGDFTANVAATVQNALAEYPHRDITKIVFDFADLTFIASSGLRVLVFAKKRMKAGMDVEIVNVGAAARKILNMSGLADMFDMVA